MQMTLMQHFKELKARAAWSLGFFIFAFAAGLWAAPTLRVLITAPLLGVWDGGKMILTGVADNLTIQFSLAGLFAAVASMPFVLLQLWKYVSPALKKTERRAAILLVSTSPLLFAAGALFAYFVLLPFMFGFFISLGDDSAAMLPNVRDYLSFTIDILKAFGLAFQFPLVLVLLNRAGVLPKKSVLGASRYIVVAIFVLAAILTPPDVISQIALAMPLVLLFGLSLIFMV